jgi:hypothetical protein
MMTDDAGMRRRSEVHAILFIELRDFCLSVILVIISSGFFAITEG